MMKRITSRQNPLVARYRSVARGEATELVRAAQRRGYAVAAGEQLFGEFPAEPAGGAGDEPGRRGVLGSGHASSLLDPVCDGGAEFHGPAHRA